LLAHTKRTVPAAQVALVPLIDAPDASEQLALTRISPAAQLPVAPEPSTT